MSPLKKIAVLTLAMSSYAAYAGSMGKACTKGNISVPCINKTWDFEAQALYLKPAYSGELGTIGAVNFNVANATERYIDTDPDWNWGFKLAGVYHFNSGNDIDLNWYHLIGNTTITNINDIDAPTNFGFRQTGTETHSIKPSWDAVNLELGQLIDLTTFKRFRVHGGVQFVNIKANTSLDGYDNYAGFSSGNDAHTANATTKYNGFGPRIGIDMIYPIINTLDVYADLAGAVLAGSSQFKRSYVDNVGNSPGFPSSSFASRSAVVVPEIEGKLGLTYSKETGLGSISLDVGYMWLTYIDPLLFSQWKPVGNNQTLNVANRVDSESHFTLNGPYFGLKWMGINRQTA